ncbi:NIPSNAP family protein [Eubacteriales bacterium OttesenSCG-928-N14]|nr:NIPSNAP family protein [Eubacteriales bacterium OttesenSCG-928-N14]
MLYELRIYGIAEGKMDKILTFMRDTNLRFFKKHGFGIEGMWIPADDNSKYYYLLSFEDLADKEAKWAAFYAEPDWAKEQEALDLRDTVTSVESYLMERVPFLD